MPPVQKALRLDRAVLRRLQLAFVKTRPEPKSFTRTCITIAGRAFIAVGVIVTIALHH
jgi:hypothetical protein